jgi:predicted O-methyltransferase YrrM
VLEKEWRYTLSDEEDRIHSFGRVPEDGKLIAFWSIPRSTGQFIQFMVELLQAKTILELGCSAGYSTLFLASGAEKTNGEVFTTELLQQKILLAKKHFQESGLNNKINLIEGEIKTTLENWNAEKKIDLVFMDADKENYSAYLQQLYPLVRRGGIIIVDNAGKVAMPDGSFVQCKHITEFVTQVKNDVRFTSHYLDVDNGLLLILKN